MNGWDKNFCKYNLPNIDYNTIANMDYINDNIESNKHMEVIYLGNIVSLDIYRSFNYNWEDISDKNLYFYIMDNIKFHKIFYELKDYIKEKLNLTKFNCIHMRIEDDALSHFSHCYKLTDHDYNKQLITFYEDNIKNICQDQKPIYICSGMLEFHNKTNLNYYKNLIKTNKLLRDKTNISIDKYYLHNRELIAIIDLLISFDSDNFVGSGISSFSVYIKAHHILCNKPFALFYPSV